MPQPKQHTWPEGTLPAVLEAFIWVSTIDPVKTTGHDGRLIDVIRITGPVKAPEDAAGLDATKMGAQAIADDAARSVRASLLRQAEDAIAAAQAAGWALNEHPEISIGGRLRRDRESGLDIPVAEATVDLWFRVPE
jgi:hypothetical protein